MITASTLRVAFRAGCLAGLLVAGGTKLCAQTPSPALLVLEKDAEQLDIVDPSALRIVARVPSGGGPHEVAASADGKFAYISNYMTQ